MEIESLETAAIIDDMTDSIHSDVEDHDVSIAMWQFDKCRLRRACAASF